MRIIGNLFRKCYGYLFCERWNIGIIDTPIHTFLTPGFSPSIQWFPAPPDNKFIADPFAVRKGNIVHVLFEDYDYHTSKGCISTTSFDGKSFSPYKVVINNSFHMSYPYLLEYKNRVYCIPETMEAKEVSLYEAKEFPYRWEKAATLIKDFAGVDNTVFEYDGYWWLFATDENDEFNVKLKIWYAPDLFGPWEPHAANPVKVDISSARPAGTPFIYNNYLYRPSQDCAETYGSKIVLNRVIRLTPSEFREDEATIIKPFKDSPYPDGLHTISAVGDMTVIDAKKKVFMGRNRDMLRFKIKDIRNKLLNRHI